MQQPSSLINKYILTVSCLIFPFIVYSQFTQTYFSDDLEFRKGIEYYDLRFFAGAQRQFQLAKNRQLKNADLRYPQKLAVASLMEALSAVKAISPEGDKLMKDFIRDYSPEPISAKAVLEMGNYYYNQKNYPGAIEFYELADQMPLTAAERAEADFKLGYSYFVRKDFHTAFSVLSRSKELQTEYFYPINYYYGLTCFYLEYLEEAVSAFERVRRSERYRPYVPYYVTQIYFAQNKYNDVISYGENALDEPDIQNRPGLNHIIGQSYFELGNYAAALPFLEYHEANSAKLRKEDFFQLGYVQYVERQYEKAVTHLSHLYEDTTELGQTAMLYLADSYLKLDDKNSARNAFKKSAELSTNVALQEDALMQYAKLSSELGFNREAISAATQFSETSTYYLEAQELISYVLLTTRDYDNAIATIENVATPSPALREAYQIVTYSKGVQSYNQKQYEEAKTFFAKSLNYPVSSRYKAMTFFYQGQISSIEQLYQKSINEINSYFTVKKSLEELPKEVASGYASYTQGYNYLKMNNFSSAEGFFQEAVADIKRNPASYDQFAKTVILPDALLRVGDCLFKRNNYTEAGRFYQEVIDNKYRGNIYATYQKAIIKGLQGIPVDKIVLLETIVSNSPENEFVDESLLELSNTYLSIGKFQQAMPPLLDLITRFKGQSSYVNKAYLQLGLISFNQGDERSSLEYYQKVFENNPTASEASEALKSIEEIMVDRMGQPDKYVRFVESLPGLKVSDRAKDSLSYRVANSLYESGQFEKAISSYDEYIRNFPAGLFIIDALYNKAESNLLLKKYPAALQAYEALLDKGPSRHFESATEKAAIIASTYKESLDHNKALKYFSNLEKIASAPDKRYKARLGALRAAYKVHHEEMIAEFAEKVLNNPNIVQEEKSEAYYYRGKLYFNRKNFDAALEDFNKVALYVNNEMAAEARFLIAEIYYLRKDLETAELLIQNANKESASYPYWVAKSLLLYADILAEKGDFFNAAAALEAVIENFKEDETIRQEAKSKLEQLELRKRESNRIYNPEELDQLELQEGH